jgi:Flp pilus assembly protein TadD
VTAGGLALAGLGASSWVQSGVWHNSESLWRSAVTAHPTCARCRGKLGNALLAAGLPREAEAELTRAIALRPERPTAHNSLGALLVAQGRPGEAEAAFREAIRLAPHYAEAVANLGALHARQRRYAEAVAEAVTLFREATALRPAEATFWRNLGQALIEDGKVTEALPPLERAVALRSEGAAERFWLARAYLLAGRPAEAQAQIGVLRSLDATAAAGLYATWPPDRAGDPGGHAMTVPEFPGRDGYLRP